MPIAFIEKSRLRRTLSNDGSDVDTLLPSAKCPFAVALRISLHLNQCMDPIRKAFEEVNRIMIESNMCHVLQEQKDPAKTTALRGFPLGVRYIPLDEVNDILTSLLSCAKAEDAKWAYNFSKIIAEGCSSEDRIVDAAAMTACVWPLTRLEPGMILRLAFDQFNTSESDVISAEALSELLHILFEGSAALLLDIALKPSRYGLQLQGMKERDLDDARRAFTCIFDCEKIPEIVARCEQSAIKRLRQTDDDEWDPYKEVRYSTQSSDEFTISSNESNQSSAPSYGLADTFGRDVPSGSIIKLEDITACYMLTRRLSLVSHNAWTLS